VSYLQFNKAEQSRRLEYSIREMLQNLWKKLCDSELTGYVPHTLTEFD
jgi:hypothetical protein